MLTHRQAPSHSKVAAWRDVVPINMLVVDNSGKQWLEICQAIKVGTLV